MTIIVVDTTINAAIDAAAPGDVVEVPAGVYHERVLVDKRVMVSGQPGAVIDGGWDGRTLTTNAQSQIMISAAGATVRGLTVRDCEGKGVSITASDTTLEDCHVRNCQRDGLVIHGGAGDGISGVLVADCSFVELCMAMALDKGSQSVGGTFVSVNVADSIYLNNLFAYGWKEGFLIDRNTRRCVYRGNVLMDTNHGGVYFNHSQDNLFENNVILHSNPPEFAGAAGRWPAAVIFGDETAIPSRFNPQRGNRFVGNIVVGWGRLFEVRNGNNYDTTLIDTAIIGNTFIAGPNTVEAVNIAAPKGGRAHGAEFGGNLIMARGAKSAAAGGVTFRGNAWDTEPVAAARGDGDYYGALELANPVGAIAAGSDRRPVGFDRENYRPVWASIVGNMGAGALAAIEPPPPPDPKPSITERITQIWATLEGAALEIDAAMDALDALASELESGD